MLLLSSVMSVSSSRTPSIKMIVLLVLANKHKPNHFIELSSNSLSKPKVFLLYSLVITQFNAVVVVVVAWDCYSIFVKSCVVPFVFIKLDLLDSSTCTIFRLVFPTWLFAESLDAQRNDTNNNITTQQMNLNWPFFLFPWERERECVSL